MTDPEITFNANPTQKAFINSRAEADLFSSRKGEGKSTALCWACWYHTRNNPGAQWAIIRDTWTNLRRTTLAEFFRWFPAGVWGTWHEQNREFTWNPHLMGPGSRVTFLGLDDKTDAAKVASMPLGGVGLDEPCPAASEGLGIDDFVFTTAMGQLRQPGMRWYAAKIAQNNSDETHWTYRRFVDPGTGPHGGALLPLQEPGFRLWQPVYAENTANLKPGYYEAMRREWADRPDLVSRFVDGKITNQLIGRPVTPEWDDNVHLARELVPVRGTDLILCWDWGNCYDDQTEVLTETGWKYFGELERGERVATLNRETGLVEYQCPQRLVRRPYTGPMISYSDRAIDFCVTPEHGVPVERDINGNWRTEKVTAEWLYSRKRHHCRLPLAGKWEGEPGNPLDMDDLVFAALIGWIVAEGSIGSTGITIYQEKESPLEGLLAETGMRWTPIRAYGKAAGWRTSDRRLREYLRDLGTQNVRRIPRAVFRLPPAALRAFLDAYIAGDGHRRRNEITAYTVSPGLADDLQELAIKIGLNARVRKRAPAKSRLADGRVISSGPGYDVSFRVSRHAYMQGQFHRLHYTGEIFCATVPNGTLWVRRGGRVHLNGNTPACAITQLTPLGHWLILETHVGVDVGVYELITDQIKPALRDRYRRFKWWHTGDPSGARKEQSSVDQSAVRVVKKELGGVWRPGPQDPMDGVPALRSVMRSIGRVKVDRVRAKEAWWALRGGWHFHIARSGVAGGRPVKDVHSHIGDALAHGAAVIFPLGTLRERKSATPPKEASW